jgi:ABC-type dipeptide/oligopeptide/nickel transport system permease component
LPVYVLIFGITLPLYIGTQALTETLFDDPGVGRVLIAEFTQFRSTGFGISVAQSGTSGNLYQVTIFLLLLLVLTSSLLADILAHYLDPRLAQDPRGR